MVACGSSRNAHNMQLFATADLAMSATPHPPVREHGLMYGECARRGWGGIHGELPESITSVPCALNLNRRFSMEELIEFIATSRTLLDAVRQAAQFGLGKSLSDVSRSSGYTYRLLERYPGEAFCDMGMSFGWGVA